MQLCQHTCVLQKQGTLSHLSVCLAETVQKSVAAAVSTHMCVCVMQKAGGPGSAECLAADEC